MEAANLSTMNTNDYLSTAVKNLMISVKHNNELRVASHARAINFLLSHMTGDPSATFFEEVKGLLTHPNKEMQLVGIQLYHKLGIEPDRFAEQILNMFDTIEPDENVVYRSHTQKRVAQTQSEKQGKIPKMEKEEDGGETTDDGGED